MKMAYLSISVPVVAVLITIFTFVDGVDKGESIRVAYFPNIGHAIAIVGTEKGVFADSLDGIEVKTRVFDSGPQVVEALFADSIDMAYVGPGPAINGYLNSENGIRILAGAASGGASLVLHPDSSEGNFTFDGKKIAVPPIGNTQDVSLRTLVRETGLDTAERGGSVAIYNLPNPDIYTLFSKGDIDAAWVAEPWATILERELGGHRLFHEEDLWPEGRFASVLLVADAQYASDNAAAIITWLEAHEKTASWINQNQDDSAALFNEFLDGHLGGRLDEQVLRISLSNVEITTDPLEDSIHVFAERADRLGYLGRGGYDISDIFYDDVRLHSSGGDLTGHT